MTLTRRRFVATTLGAIATGTLSDAAEDRRPPLAPLAGEVGITTSSLDAHIARDPAAAKSGQFSLFELPRVLRDELGMKVVDLNTTTLGSLAPAHLDRFREAAEKSGCVLTNLKMNYTDIDMGSQDDSVRMTALTKYKQAIDAAARLKLRWARPLPLKSAPHRSAYIASFRELAAYARERGIQLLVENYGWMQADAVSVSNLIAEADCNLAACPDTGNWDNEELRWAGLAKTFPLAVTCDFKARELGPAGEHPLYDLRRCFQIGWNSGFRGPWCLEHAHRDRAQLFRELISLRELLQGWMR